MCPGKRGKPKALRIAEKIRDDLSEVYFLEVIQENGDKAVVEHKISCSIGACLFVRNDASHESILKWADGSMYRAKEAGRNLVFFHQ
jgi:GGDEF domain-containing protein